jgi:hypothetical protein
VSSTDRPKSATIARVILGAAAVDCEQVHAGLLAQPANSLSSLAFVAAGIWIVARARRTATNVHAIVVGLATIAVGVGSLAFHARNGAAAHRLHDTTVLVVLALVAIRHVSRGRQSLAQAAPFVAVAASIAVLGVPTSTSALSFLFVSAIAVRLCIEWRRGQSVIHRPLAATMLVGLAASSLGRRGSVLCSPQSFLQLHAVWHVVMAVSIAWWTDRAVLRVRSLRHQHHELPRLVAQHARDVAGAGHVLGEAHIARTESLRPTALDLDLHLAAERDDVDR